MRIMAGYKGELTWQSAESGAAGKVGLSEICGAFIRGGAGG